MFNMDVKIRFREFKSDLIGGIEFPIGRYKGGLNSLIRAKKGLWMLVLFWTGLMPMLSTGQGTDLLANTSADLVATVFGEGKRYIYLGEGLFALMAYIKTRNLMVFGGIFIVSVFLNSILAKLIS